MSQHLTVCICTYKRPRLLKRLLDELQKQETGGQFTYSVVVADNDHLQSAKATVLDFAKNSSVRIKYCVEPQQNIAMVRNRAIANAEGDYIVFIDDDEFPTPTWLDSLFTTVQKYRVDGVLGPVRPFFETPPPKWLVKGGFCERPEYVTGTRLGWQDTRTGNVLLTKSIMDGMPEPFRPEFGVGSEDTDFFRRMIEQGCRFVWCNEAVVYEVVPPERWKRTFMLKRALMRGQNQKHLANMKSVAKSMVAVPGYAILLPFLLFLGQHVFLKYFIKLLDHVGKLCGVLGWKPVGSKYVSG